MLLLLSTPLFGHVSMTYVEGSDLAIRSANSKTGDGRANVANACGGNAAPGANGRGTIKDGDEVTLAINYAAGHQSAQNAFSMRYACGDGSAGSVEAASAKLTAAANNCKGTAAGAATAYGANGIPAPKAIVPGGYTVTCTLPKQDVAAAKDCVISLADQRDWGGCVDVSVLPAAAALPPAPPPAPPASSRARSRAMWAARIPLILCSAAAFFPAFIFIIAREARRSISGRLGKLPISAWSASASFNIAATSSSVTKLNAGKPRMASLNSSRDILEPSLALNTMAEMNARAARRP